MSGKRLLKIAVDATALCLAGVMLAAVTSCNSSSSSRTASQSDAASTPAPVLNKTTTVGYFVKGKELFAENCTTCHGLQGQGVAHLGADLQTSKFLASSSDAQLVAFIEQGRSATDPLNTMHVAMPPKGGNPALTPQDLYDIVTFLRQIQKTHAEAK